MARLKENSKNKEKKCWMKGEDFIETQDDLHIIDREIKRLKELISDSKGDITTAIFWRMKKIKIRPDGSHIIFEDCTTYA